MVYSLSRYLQVAPFLWQGSTLSSSDALDAEVSLGCLLPPEVLCAKPTGIVKLPSSPTRSRIERRHREREAADVWGIGTLAFELATGRVAGKCVVNDTARRPYCSAVVLTGFFCGVGGPRSKCIQFAASADQYFRSTV